MTNPMEQMAEDDEFMQDQGEPEDAEYLKDKDDV